MPQKDHLPFVHPGQDEGILTELLSSLALYSLPDPCREEESKNPELDLVPACTPPTPTPCMHWI